MVARDSCNREVRVILHNPMDHVRSLVPDPVAMAPTKEGAIENEWFPELPSKNQSVGSAVALFANRRVIEIKFSRENRRLSLAPPSDSPLRLIRADALIDSVGNRTYDRDHLKAPRAVLTPSGADLDVVSTRGDELIVHPREEKFHNLAPSANLPLPHFSTSLRLASAFSGFPGSCHNSGRFADGAKL
jgi:hypothetical protein